MKDLDSTVLNVELTLISIIQGVALYFLVESSRTPIVERNFVVWPYIASGLVVIFLFWSRSVIHSLTVIRWPLEFGHNFIYIASTLLEAVIFTQVGNPLHWFTLSAAYSVLIWVLFIWDLKMIRKREQEDRSAAGRQLFPAVAKMQTANIRYLMPATLAFNLGAAALIYFFPELFLVKGWHLALVFFQLGAAIVYLISGLRFLSKAHPLLKEIVSS